MKKLTNLLPTVEKITLALLFISAVIAYSFGSFILLNFSILLLAVTYFLNAYKLNEIKYEENEQLGFDVLIGTSILPKVLWINSSVILLGIIFFHLQFPGAMNMFGIGVAGISICLAIIIFMVVAKVKYIQTVFPVLYRAIPLFLISIFILTL